MHSLGFQNRLSNPNLYDILPTLPPMGGSYYAPLKGKPHLTRLLTGAGVLAIGQNAILSYRKFRTGKTEAEEKHKEF
ncbi:MAG TPA: hypothetical protein VI755_05075 [Anaerolineales bacterium]|nr:hypothetical protein [Anaerolineales bacterium]